MTNNLEEYRAGLDVGSTTAKLVIIDAEETIVFSKYVRHNTKINATVERIFKEVKEKIGNIRFSFNITGSAGMGLSEKFHIPFVQEVIATAEVVKVKFSELKTLIDIGGEDSKMIFFHQNKPPDIRMNGNCAGGTGAFIDQMAGLLNMNPLQLDKLAETHTKIYPIASRCGVFAKTDIQNLLSNKIPKADIAASIFHAVALQTMNTLARGFEIVPKLMFTGGPFSFLPNFTKIFSKTIKVAPQDMLQTNAPELMTALGAAIFPQKNEQSIRLDELIARIKKHENTPTLNTNRLAPLFASQTAFADWQKRKIGKNVKRCDFTNYDKQKCYIGIDSGSTTTKICVIGEDNELLFDFYKSNHGNPIETVQEGLLLIAKEIEKSQQNIHIAQTAVTGYGEDLIKASFGIDFGMVETIAHFRAATFFSPKVSFILDIGGQDMKAIFVENGLIKRIELNESCSSGCGSFYESFGKSLEYSVSDFSLKACQAKNPCDLGTRCTVFMNSKVKQSLRENATLEDISAGLAISVIKNALFKVLKLNNYDALGNFVVVQGGTFRNPAILRALENLTGKTVFCTDIPELMGALGAALAAKNKNKGKAQKSAFIGFENVKNVNHYTTKQITCKGCDNNCYITKFEFSENRSFVSGNKCEKIFSNKGEQYKKGFNLFAFKEKLIFAKIEKASTQRKIKIGFPRVLNMFDNYPFWNALFSKLGFETILSDNSTYALYEKGLGTLMSDSICFPAKLVHGHVFNLINKQVDRIFFPFVVYEDEEFEFAQNSFNCPIVSSYSDVVKSSIDPFSKYKIPIDSPVISFTNKKLLRKACFSYLKQFKVSKTEFSKAFAFALAQKEAVKQKIQRKAKEIIERNRKNKSICIILAGRPYHIDPLINHRSPDILTDLGCDVLTEDAVPNLIEKENTRQIITQWSYPNRIFNAAKWLAKQEHNFQFIQLNSFGCGPDAIVVDECIDILSEKGKNHSLIRIDEISSTGSIRLRLRSIIESIKMNDAQREHACKKNVPAALFTEKEKHRTILAPYFGDMYSPYLPTIFALGGYKLINLPKPNKKSVEFGLKYSNNEICYPATIIVGDIIKALKSGKYNREEVAVGITQTGGQCRASSYLALIKRALNAAGFSDVPVISVNAGNTENFQPGFKINWRKLLPTVFTTMLFADSLAKIYYSTIVREKNKGETMRLYNKYQQKSLPLILGKKNALLYDLLKEAVDDFNTLPTKGGAFPKIGLVGEIYVKYNSFGHQNITDWLIKNGIEVVVPPIIDFFLQFFVNREVNKKQYIRKTNLVSDFMSFILEYKVNRHVERVNKILSNFKFYSPIIGIRDIAQKASRILSLANQFGEGWLIPAEIAEFAENQINYVVSVQPFGCIANHVVSKGVEKRIKDLYPNLNLLFLDFDDGVSPVNILNRLHFMARNVKETIKYRQ